GGLSDMVDFKDHEMFPTPTKGGASDMKGGDKLRGKAPKSTEDGASDGDDMAGDIRGKPPTGATMDGATDHKRDGVDPDQVKRGGDVDMEDKKKHVNIGKDTVLSGEVHDHALPLARKGEVEVRVAMEACAKCGEKHEANAACASKAASAALEARERAAERG